MKTNLLISGILLGAVTFISAATNDLTSAIQRGLFEEEANQNLGAAIQAYQSVASQFDKDRKLAATAIFRLGECYRKQGNTNDAAAQYERILRDFSDQPTLVTLSRQNLAGIGPALNRIPADEARLQRKAVLEAEIKLLEQQMESNGEMLTASKLQALVESNLVARATFDRAPEESLSLVVGTYWQSEGQDKVEVPFHAKVKLLPELEASLIRLPQFQGRRHLAGLRMQLAAINAELAAGPSNLSDSARQEQKRLLEEEIKLVQKQLDMLEKRAQNSGAVVDTEVWRAQREILELKRKIAALDAGLPISFAPAETSPPVAPSEADEVRRIQALIKDSPDLINAPNANGLTLLQSAVSGGKLDVVKALLEMGAAVDGGREPGLTPLHYAAEHGHKAVVDFLLSKGAKTDAQTESGVTPLHLAARKGYYAIAKTLLAAGAPVNAHATQKSPSAGTTDLQFSVGIGKSPLHLVADGGYTSMVELLLAQGADVNAEDGEGRTPLSYAVQKHYKAVTELLLAAHANPNGGRQNLPLVLAAGYGDIPVLRLLLANGADPNTNAVTSVSSSPGGYPSSGDYPSGNFTPLSMAVRRQHADAVQELLRAKANPNVMGARQGVPLLFDALGDAPVLKALLEGGADPNRLDPQSMSPLLLAVFQTNQPAVELLLRFHADVNAAPTGAFTPLHAAAANGARAIAEMLLKAGAPVNARSHQDGQTPLRVAVERKQPGLAQLLLANKADPNAKDNGGWTPLHLAVSDGQRELVELLLANKADPNERNKAGQTPLDLAKSQNTSVMSMELVGVAASAPLNYQWRTTDGTPTNAPSQESKPETMADLLRRKGAVDDLPQPDLIVARRPSTEYLGTDSLIKGTNDWSQFTLLELIAMEYGFLSASPSTWGNEGGLPASSFFDSAFSQSTRLGFPDLARLRIRRPAADRKSWQVQPVDLGPALEAGDCSKDVRLGWGDVVEIPEADHPLNEKWRGFSKTELANLKKCLARQVQIVINGQATNMTLVLGVFEVGEPNDAAISPITDMKRWHARQLGQAYIQDHTSFWLKPVLLESKLVLTSSDLSRVKVTRRDPASGQTHEWVVDCLGNPDLWLRDGDKIEVPEKGEASAAAAPPGPQPSPK